MQKMLPPTLLLCTIVVMIVVHFVVPGTLVIRLPYNLLGIVVLLLGLAMATYESRRFERFETTIKTFDEPGIMITDGLFRYSRNPMYLGFVIFLLGIFILLGSLTPFFSVVLFVIITDRWYIPIEEKMMEDKFGPHYRMYRAKTARWFIL